MRPLVDGSRTPVREEGTDSCIIVAANSGHNISIDELELVVEAIQKVINNKCL